MQNLMIIGYMNLLLLDNTESSSYITERGIQKDKFNQNI